MVPERLQGDRHFSLAALKYTSSALLHPDKRVEFREDLEFVLEAQHNEEGRGTKFEHKTTSRL